MGHGLQRAGTGRSGTVQRLPFFRLSPIDERRRRLLTRTLPVVLIAVGAVAASAVRGSGPSAPSPAQAFAKAWEAQRLAPMHAQLTPGAARTYPRATSPDHSGP